MIEIEQCPVCQGRDIAEKYPATFSGTPSDAVQFFLTNRERAVRGRIAECKDCGFIFTSPQFTPEEYDFIYSQVASSWSKDESQTTSEHARFAGLAKALRRHASGGRLLDFGCGSGAFLEQIPEFDAIGFEVDSEQSDWDGKVFRGSVDDARQQSSEFADGSFDIITAWDVLEHLPKLDQSLDQIYAMLKPGGLFVFTVPNVGSAAAKLTGRFWNSFLLEHIWYFRPDTIERILTRRGFVKESIKGIPFPADLNLVARRIRQTLQMPAPAKPNKGSTVLPLPIGLMIGVFRKPR